MVLISFFSQAKTQQTVFRDHGFFVRAMTRTATRLAAAEITPSRIRERVTGLETSRT